MATLRAHVACIYYASRMGTTAAAARPHLRGSDLHGQVLGSLHVARRGRLPPLPLLLQRHLELRSARLHLRQLSLRRFPRVYKGFSG